MKRRRTFFQVALVALIAVPQLPGTSQGLTQNQLKGWSNARSATCVSGRRRISRSNA